MPRVRPGAEPGPDGLTDKQRVFVEQYLLVWNSAEAARRAGYSTKTARAIGWSNLRKPEIRRTIDARLEDMAMSANEVLARLTEMARGDLGDFFSQQRGHLVLDLAAASKAGKLHLIKKYRLGSNSESIEMHDALAALELIGRYHGLFADLHGHQGQLSLVGMTMEQWKAQAASAAQKLRAKFAEPLETRSANGGSAGAGSNGVHDWPTADDSPGTA